MSRSPGRDRVVLRCEELERRETPSATVWENQSFNDIALGAIPSSWQQWSGSGSNSFAASKLRAFTGAQSLATTGSSNLTARTWDAEVLPADFAASEYVYLNSLQPVQLFVRGQSLSGNAPTYYALSINRGLQAQILKVVNGTTTVLASIQSATYLSNAWVQVSLTPLGNQLSAQIYRPDTGQYLNSAGKWQSAATNVMQVSDTSIAADGQIGLDRPAQYADTVTVDDFQIWTAAATQQNFDGTPLGQLPASWSGWSNVGAASLVAANTASQSPSQSLQSSSTSSTAQARAWLTTPLPQNVEATASFLVSSLIPAQLIARGSNLGTSTPSYYAVSVSRGLAVSLLKVVNGVTTNLGTETSKSYFSNQWVTVSLATTNSDIQAVVYRSDTGQYLNSAGNWVAGFSRAIDVHDAAIAGIGLAGVDRPAVFAGTLNVDDFQVRTANGDIAPPAVTIQSPAKGATLTGTVPIVAAASHSSGIDHVEFWVDGTLRFATSSSPFQWNLDTTALANGAHVITVKAYDNLGDVSSATMACSVNNNLPPLPTIPRNNGAVNIAELAYAGTPIDPFAQNLLQTSVDVVISNPSNQAKIYSIAPNTPQLLYTNASNMYGDLLTNWEAFAVANGIDPEAAFYHVTQATPFTGDSASSQPVAWFWSVLVGSTGSWTNDTSQAHATSGANVKFGGLGQSVAIGYPQPFAEIDLNLASAASKGWAGALQYVSAVDANGSPTGWKTLTTYSDTTNGLANSGQILFNPPTDWVSATIGGSQRLYFARVLTATGGTAPIATNILSADYTNSKGTDSGVIPAFDYAADLNHDGYLSPSEYANRKPGMNARFACQGRVFYMSYGQMRFAVNPADTAVQNWFTQFATQLLARYPIAAGLFVDNSNAVSPVSGISTVESATDYSQNYAAMLAIASQKIAPHWIMANVAGGGTQTNGVILATAAVYDESALRPLNENYAQFQDLATAINQWQVLRDPSAYMVIDSDPAGGSPTDPQTQIATLAAYEMIANPQTTYLDFYGGYDPSSSWAEHWSPAAAYNIGNPLGNCFVAQSGADPSKSALTYEVFERQYQNALVLYKPLSYKLGVGTGTLTPASATTFQLNESYRVLEADGTLSAPVTSVSLTNGSGAILVKT